MKKKVDVFKILKEKGILESELYKMFDRGGVLEFPTKVQDVVVAMAEDYVNFHSMFTDSIYCNFELRFYDEKARS